MRGRRSPAVTAGSAAHFRPGSLASACVQDVATLDIRLAGPNDAGELAGTTRLGFESYREWAPAGWRPPPRELELRAIRERLKQSTTWCAMAIEAGGEPAGHVGI